MRRPGPDPMDRREGYPEPFRDQNGHRAIRFPSRGRLSASHHPPLSPWVPVDGVPSAAGIDPERNPRHGADEPPMVFRGSSVSTTGGRIRRERSSYPSDRQRRGFRRSRLAGGRRSRAHDDSGRGPRRPAMSAPGSSPAFAPTRLDSAPGVPVGSARTAEWRDLTARDGGCLGHQSKNPLRPLSLHAATRGNRGARRPSEIETLGERP